MKSDIKNSNRLKNAILKEVTRSERLSSIDIVSLAQRIKSDFNTTHVLCEELAREEYVRLAKVNEHKALKDNQHVYRTIKGEVFIRNGGYLSGVSSFLHNIKRQITAANIAAILASLLVAYLIYKLGWNN